MFDAGSSGVFGAPPGADFPKYLYLGLQQRLKSTQPLDWAAVEIYVNTRRMERRLRALFDDGSTKILPRIRLLTELPETPDTLSVPSAIPDLRRKLELAQLVTDFLDLQPDVAPKSAVFDLTDSLLALMDEMHVEGVSPDALHTLDVSHLSEHWARTRSFLSIVERYFGPSSAEPFSAAARNRLVTEKICEGWRTHPPTHPVIVAGSTGSRGTTALLMQAVAALPQGALVLPGFDFEQPASVWQTLDNGLQSEDHPQYRFAALCKRLEIAPQAVMPWADGGFDFPRNRLISLSLRPAPVTDQWMDEGQHLPDIAQTTRAMTLIEAPSPRHEALAIALRLRKAVEDNQTAALISPDRQLTRQVTAALDRWGIEPDDSAGVPLSQSAPGRFLRHIAALFGQVLTSEALLTLLKHPLTCSAQGRGDHLRLTRELELWLRRSGPPFPTEQALMAWAGANGALSDAGPWVNWVCSWLCRLSEVSERPLHDHVSAHLEIAEGLAAGVVSAGSGGLWDKAAGAEASAAMQALFEHSDHGGVLDPRAYSNLLHSHLNSHEVRDPSRPHPGVMIWGTIEARVQGADLVILGGMNEGVWPKSPTPDPWMNREMRHKSGLLLPERNIGLSAHDFQQAVAAPDVVISRAIRDAEAETVPSRWVNRLVNMLNGLPDQGGQSALAQMRARGRVWLDMAAQLEAPATSTPPANRPSPCPPAAFRPNSLSVTRIATLIRDPYAIYAAYVLGLRVMRPLRPEPDAPLRGTILHRVMERFVRDASFDEPAALSAQLINIADQVFLTDAPWPTARRMWRARLERIAPRFLDSEEQRRARAHWIALETKGRTALTNGFTLTAEADRIDLTDQGNLIIYDYKTGQPPTTKQVKEYDKQLLLEAAIAERGGFTNVPANHVAQVEYIGLGTKPGGPIDLGDDLVSRTWQELHDLTTAYQAPDQGYAARRAMALRTDVSDYDHLSRFGEWDEGQPAQKTKVQK